MSTLTDQIKAKCAVIAENQAKIYEKGKSEGGGGEPTTPTDNIRTCMNSWYQYLIQQNGWVGMYGSMFDDTGNEIIIDELEYPIGTKNQISFNNFTKLMCVDEAEGYPMSLSVPVKKFVGKLDASNATDISYMYANCSKLTDIGDVVFSDKITACTCMFLSCYRLTDAPIINTSNVISVSAMFSTCVALKRIPTYDLRNATNTSSIVANCSKLTNIRLKNLKVGTQIGSARNYGHLIVVDDLIFMIYHLRDTGSLKTFTIGSANLEKLANVYVKTIPITDAMRAEDDLIDEKLPFEVCESTDEGAIAIKDYVGYKNWSLK